MSATKVLVFYNTLALVGSPSTCLRRIVKIDNDTDSQFHVAAFGETKFELPIAIYSTFLFEIDIANYIIANPVSIVL